MTQTDSTTWRGRRVRAARRGGPATSPIPDGPHGAAGRVSGRDSGSDQFAAVRDPDFLALGLGGTNMLAMLWSVALGKRCVGVEMRGDPSLGVHWNVREDLFHHLGAIDHLMLERYGEQGVPRRGHGVPFKLADCFYHPDTEAGAVAADEVVTGFLDRQLGEDAH